MYGATVSNIGLSDDLYKWRKIMANRKDQSKVSSMIALLLLVFVALACGNSQATQGQNNAGYSYDLPSELKRQRDTAITAEKESKRLLLENIELKHASEIKELEVKYKFEISNLKDSHRAEIEALQKKQTQEIANLESVHEQKIDQITSTYESQKTALESKLFYWKIGGISAAVLAAFFFINCLVIAGRLPE